MDTCRANGDGAKGKSAAQTSGILKLACMLLGAVLASSCCGNGLRVLQLATKHQEVGDRQEANRRRPTLLEEPQDRPPPRLAARVGVADVPAAWAPPACIGKQGRGERWKSKGKDYTNAKG